MYTVTYVNKIHLISATFIDIALHIYFSIPTANCSGKFIFQAKKKEKLFLCKNECSHTQCIFIIVMDTHCVQKKLL